MEDEVKVYNEEEEEDVKEEMQETEAEKVEKGDESPKNSMLIFVNKRGSLDVEIRGAWTARQIRAIQLAVVKSYRNKKKEAITKKEE